MKERLLELLGKGKSNATTRKDLADYLGINDRELRVLIHELRSSGAPILSSSGNSGYYLPAEGKIGERECLEFMAQQHSRAINCFDSCKGVKTFLSNIGQCEI